MESSIFHTPFVPIGTLILSLALSATTPLPAQGAVAKPLDAAEAALTKSATRMLFRYASIARSRKFGQKEKDAYELIINEYDKNHSRARRALDYRLQKNEWKLIPPKKRRTWLDKANRTGRYAVQQAWLKTRKKLAEEHTALGLKMMAAGAEFEERGKAHLRRAVLYDPLGKQAHEALGHVPCKMGEITYYGTAEQVAFMRRMKSIETYALMLAKKTYNPQPVKYIPRELAKTGLEIFGAKTEHFTIFVRGTQDNANDVVQWGERALDFMDFVVGDNKRIKRRARRAMLRYGWIGILWTEPEMARFRRANPTLVPKKKGRYMNLIFDSGKGQERKQCQVVTINMPSYMHDFLIAHVFHYGLGDKTNIGLLEGTHHAATWFLKSTCFAKYGAEPKGTTTNRKLVLPEGANWWLREMRNQAIAREDTPLNVIPRTELYRFHADIRLKTWSFHVWAMARFPEAWVEFLNGHPTERIPFPEEVDKVGAKCFGMPLAQVEAEWREWASGRGVTAAATGYGPPLLPEFPNRNELKGLERLNAVRRAVTCWSEGGGDEKTEGGSTTALSVPTEQWNKCLPLVELDSEATAACKDHARFFGKHEEHWKWPEAHEEDPAKEGFSPRGMRAGLRSVIVWSNGALDAKGAVDGWIGTVYHRFPLLDYNIKRFGIAYDDEGKCEVIVLDMGSLQEPRTDALERACAFIAWPPNEMKNVPRQFCFTEHPNPLADVGLDFDAQQNTGYPVSLQFTKLITDGSFDVRMKLYEEEKRGGKLEQGAEVPCWLHTPDAPLLKRMVMRNVVFVIPKAVLKPRTTYRAVVELNAGGERKYEWSFTTGTKMQGLGRLK